MNPSPPLSLHVYKQTFVNMILQNEALILYLWEGRASPEMIFQ
jgi:hypothetical protein